MRTHIVALAVLVAFGSDSFASDLTLDGQAYLMKPIGRHVRVDLNGAPGLPALIGIAAKLGPMQLPGPGLPQGPLLKIYQAPDTDATGHTSLTIPTPDDPAFVGTTWHILGAIFDPFAPYGVDIVPGAYFTLTDGEMVTIPGGNFLMGDHLGTGDNDELPVHEVRLKEFYMQVYEVTNQEYTAYLNSAYSQGLIEVQSDVVTKAGGSQPFANLAEPYSVVQIVWDGAMFTVEPDMDKHPVTHVTWYGASAFANWRSVQEGRLPCYDPTTWKCNFKVNGYRLPTEAEWERAARGGEQSPYYDYPWGDTIDGSQANSHDSGDPWETTLLGTSTVGYYDGAQVPGGVDMANGFGLYDMSGNVWEWCHDSYLSNYYKSSPLIDPQGPLTAPPKVMRGASYYYPYTTGNYRCADRASRIDWNSSSVLGFRLVRRDFSWN